MKRHFLEQGYWNGEPAVFTAFTYEVEADKEYPLWWNNSQVGTTRQGLEITYNGETFCIDNQHGDGFIKLTEGKGSPRYGHKSVPDEPKNKQYIEEIRYMNTFLDITAARLEREQHDEYCKKTDPKEYEKLVALRNALKSHQKTYR